MKKYTKPLLVVGLLAAVFICFAVVIVGSQSMKIDKSRTVRIQTLQEIDQPQQAQLGETLTAKKIFLAHMSVGENILDGVRQIGRRVPELALSIVETDNPAEMTGPGLYHFKLGYNADPLEKFQSFETLVKKIAPADPDLVLMKLCYVDIHGPTDAETLFKQYKQTIDALQKEFPGIRFLHCTVPLTAGPLSLKEKAKESVRPFLGKITEAASNKKRHQYNQLLRSSFDADTIYDIAAAESLTPQGHPCLHGADTPALFTGYTTDGGHLNETGQNLLAQRLLLVLAQNAK